MDKIKENKIRELVVITIANVADSLKKIKRMLREGKCMRLQREYFERTKLPLPELGYFFINNKNGWIMSG